MLLKGRANGYSVLPTTSIMANIGTKNGQQWQGARFCDETGGGKGQERSRKRDDATHRVEGTKGKERLGVPHTNAGSVANTTPKRLSKHKGKVGDGSKTGMVKRCVNALVEPNAANAATAHAPAS